MARVLSVEVGVSTSGDSPGDGGSRTRVLRLNTRNVTAHLGGVFVIVDAPSDEIDWICAVLETAFAVAILPGTEEEYVARVLARFNRSGVSIVLAVWLNREVVVGSYGVEQAYVCTRGTCRDVVGEDKSVLSDEGVRIARIALSDGDSLVLGSAAVARHVPLGELHDVISKADSSPDSVQGMAQSLAHRVTERGGNEASTLVLRFEALHGVGAVTQLDTALPRWFMRRPRTAAVVLALLLLFLAAVVALALKQRSPGSLNAAKPRVVVQAATPLLPTVAPTATSSPPPATATATVETPTATSAPPTATPTSGPATVAPTIALHNPSGVSTPTSRPTAVPRRSSVAQGQPAAKPKGSASRPTATPTRPPRPTVHPTAPAPAGLSARQVAASQVILSWQAVPHATSYVLRIAGNRYYSRAPQLTLVGVLQPAKQYAWTVRAVIQSQKGPKSQQVVFRLQAMPARRWQFAPLHQLADKVFLTLRNPNTFDVDAWVQGAAQTGSSDNPVHIAAGGSAKVDLPTSSAGSGSAAVVQASGPILVQRLVIRASVTHSSYGIPQDTGAG